MNNTIKRTSQYTQGNKSSPPGRIKLANALRQLLKDKEFTAITTAEISRVVGVNEALIYRYFKDKRGLLHYVLYEYLLDFVVEMKVDLKELDRALDQVRLFIQNQINIYDKNRVFAKTLFLQCSKSRRYRADQNHEQGMGKVQCPEIQF